MEKEETSVSHKRKDVSEELEDDPGVLKKARYSWQVKGYNSTKTDKLDNADGVSVALKHSKEHLSQQDRQMSVHSLNYESVQDDISHPSVKETNYLSDCTICGSAKSLRIDTCENCQKSLSPKPPTSESENAVCFVSSSCSQDQYEKISNIQRDISTHVHAQESLTLENTINVSGESSQLYQLSSSSSSGQRSDDVLNQSDSEAEEEGLLFSSPQRCTNSLEFDLHLARWQNQHAAKAIVDNAINKTIEEMGVSPEEDVDDFTADKCYVEDEGIAEAIRRQGLICQHPVLNQNVLDSSDIISHQVHSGGTDLTQDHATPQSLTLREQSTTGDQGLIGQHLERDMVLSTSYVENQVPVSNSELIDQAVTMAICSQGLALQNNIL